MAGYKHLEITRDFERYVKNKKDSAEAYYRYLLSRLLRMFQYKNLPDTIPHEILDRYLFTNGIACITKVNGDLRVFFGNLGGVQDIYYRPTTFIVANPHVKVNGEIFSANIPVFSCPDEGVGQPTGVLMRNDSEWVGLHPLIARYSYLLAENVLTLRTADVMLRIIALITAKTDKEQISAIEYLKSIEKGELGVIGESSFHEGVEMQSPPSNNGSYLTQFIEYQQYLKGSFYNEIGLSANYNMKREAIGKGESTLDEDALLPLCDNMLKTRQEDLAKVNEMFGTDISVEFSSSWLENRIESLSALNLMAPVGQPMEQVGQPTGDAEIGANDMKEDADLAQIESDQGQNDTDDVANEVTDDKPVDEEVGEVESSINDLSCDEELTEILERAEEGNSSLVNQQVDEEGGEDDAADSTESSEDQGSVSDK